MSRQLLLFVVSLLFFCFSFLSVKLYAQTAGSVTGLVTDQQTGELLPGANIMIQGTSNGTSTNADGRFSLNGIEPGSKTLVISYLGYEAQTRSVDIESNETVFLEIELVDNFVKMEGITVQGYRQGQARALNQQKTAPNIKNVVAADLIGRFPDQNAAEALRRVPAVSVQRDQGEARYVQIRGTNPNLSNISINGEQIPSPEGDVRYAALDMIPSDVLSSIEVTKAITPDMDGDAIGGSVNLNTLSAVRDEQLFEVTVAPGYNNPNYS
ncbi:MAG: TonB-dependent receptor plug domain-containing protein [Bacteroidetes bacterium]|jgi:hypothetical protein|nr:TonB-dependent receptor plug domain-containing protein [Bacteroidota bacterium]